MVKNHRDYWLNLTSAILKEEVATTPAPVPVIPALAAAAGNSSLLCTEDYLQSLPLTRPGVAILCYEDAHCPCGWVCCPQCQTTLRLAICRQPRDQADQVEAV